MGKPVKVMAIVGSYRRGGVVDSAVDELLASVREAGAETSKVYLIEQNIGFCMNCRACTQAPGEARGKCSTVDDMNVLLDQMEAADALILASPMNFGTVTAVTKRFIERLVCLAYWPWGAKGPKLRKRRRDKRAIIVTSSAAPAFLARLSSKIVRLLKSAAAILGAETVGVLFIGFAAMEEHHKLNARTRRKAYRLGKRLIPPA